MKILLLGATGFIGPHVARMLAQQGHDLAIFSRSASSADLPEAAEHIAGDRQNLADYRDAFRRFAPEVVVDFILSSGRQAKASMDCFRGTAKRIVALSSGDVYRACGILHGTESGPLQATPLTESSELRTNSSVYGPETLERVRAFYPWLDDEYDKIPVERAILADPRLPGTVLRLPMVYGPGDPAHRLFSYLKHMDDNRPAILLQEDAAWWRGPRGYVENVAAAIALAAVSPAAAGRVYNVAEPAAYAELQWVRAIGHAAKWLGSVIPLPIELTPPHLRVPFNNAQHWDMSSQRIREELGFHEPIDESIALNRTIVWERAHAPQPDPKLFDYAAEDETLRKLRAKLGAVLA
ncbi:MAG: NAD-dependent epimerase/dehydratase family protein [Bryobacteraceae bacterium]